MNNALLAIGALLIAVLAALFAVPMTIDWNGYRGVFEEEASRVLGRDVRVSGAVAVRLLPVPFVQFEKVRIADTASETGDPFFKSDTFTMWLSITPLLRGALEAREVELKRPVVHFVVDNQGGGNWTSLTLKPGALPFVPSNVTLQSVRITNGTIEAYRKDGSALGELTAIDGELEADSLEGPLRFKGAAKWEGAPREIRFVTSKADAEGALRFKATVRVLSTSNSYALDGRIGDLKRRPRVDGELTAKMTLGAPMPAQTKRAEAERPGVELKTQVQADGTGLQLKDVQLTFENVGQPQLANGEAQMAWVGRPALDVKLGSRWLDFDRVAGGGGDTSPLTTARGLMSSLIELLPAETEAQVRLAVDQVNLGGEAVSGLNVVVARGKGPLEVREFYAGLPGGARIDFSGTVSDPKAHGLSGGLLLRGASLTRFLGWAAKGEPLSGGRDGPFMLQGRFTATESTFDLTEATAEAAGNTLRGEVHVASGERRKVSLSIEGRQIDAVQLWPSRLGAGRLERLLTLGPAAADVASAKDAAKDKKSPEPPAPLLAGARDTDLKVRIRAGQLTAGARVLRDVDADFAIERGDLSVPLVKFTTGDGATIELEGNVADAAEHPKGTLRWQAAAQSAQAAGTLLRLAGLRGEEASEDASLAAVAPLRLAGTVRFAARNEKSLDVTVDGSASGGRVRGSARLDGGRAEWRKAPADVSATLEDGDVASIVGMVSPASEGIIDKAALPRRGQAFFKAAGVADKGLVTLASVAGEGLAIAYDGRLELPADGGPAMLDGRTRFTAKDSRNVLALAGWRGNSRLASTSMEGVGTLTRKAETVTFGADRLAIGGSVATGSVAITRRTGKAAQLAADLSFDRGTMQGLLAAVTEPVSATAAPAEGKPLWPEQPFDLGALDSVEGKVKLRIGRLDLDPGLGLTDALVEANLEPGRLTVSRLDGKSLGGRLTAKATIEKAAAGVALKGELIIDDAKLEALAGAPPARSASGPVSLSTTFAGQALTPATLVSALKGKGEIALGAAEIGGFHPAPVAAVAEAGIEGKVEREGEPLAKALREAALQGTTKLGPRKLAVEIADGAARIGVISIESDEGRTSLETTVDLGQLKVDAEWKLEPWIAKRSAGSGRNIKLPPMSVTYVGPIQDIASLEPRWSISGFERELTVRKMERDVEELERLRKLDEERAARERQRAIEEERRRAAEQAAQSAAPQLDSDGTPAAPAFGTTTVAPAEPEGGSPPPDKQPAEKQAGDKLDATRPAPTVQRQPGQRPRIQRPQAEPFQPFFPKGG